MYTDEEISLMFTIHELIMFKYSRRDIFLEKHNNKTNMLDVVKNLFIYRVTNDTA